MENLFWYVEIKGRKWRRGVTTGTCAAAAAKAAVCALTHRLKNSSVEILTPQGIRIKLPVENCRIGDREASCAIRKDAGDDPDITDSIMIYATVSWLDNGKIEIEGGEGVGRVTKPGLQVPVGEAAINPVPRDMIRRAVQGFLPPGQGIKVVIHVPDGENLAAKTLNSSLGISGGISILGTTGIVEPMSEEAFKYSLVPQIEVALAAGLKTLLLTPGKIGERIARRYDVPVQATILTSNFIGYMLDEAANRGVKNLVLFGHIGKLVKIAGGIFYTHSKTADSRMEILAAHAAAMGASCGVVKALLDCVTTEAALPVLEGAGMMGVFHRLAERASRRAGQYVHNRTRIGTVMVSMQGEIIGIDKNALEIGGAAGWRLE